MTRKSAGTGGWGGLMDALGGGGSSSRGQESTYYICRKVLSESIGKLPCKLLQQAEDGGISEMRAHKLYDVLRYRPNPYMTATTFWASMEAICQDNGNSYAYIQRGKRGHAQLWILEPSQVEVWFDDAMLLCEVPDVFYIWKPQGRQIMLSSQEVIHIRTSDAPDGLVGRSVLDQLRSAIDGAKRAQGLLNKLYSNGLTSKAVLSYTGDLSKEKRDQFVAGIEAYAKGEFRDRGIENIIPLPVGTALTPLNMKLTDSQFLELKQYSALQIAAAFGCKPYHIGDYAKTSYSSEEAQQLSFYVDTLLYRLKLYEEELTYKLLTPKERAAGMRFKFNEKVALRADMQTQANILTMYVAAGLMTHNEAREQLDLPASEYGNDLMISNGAAIPLKHLGAQYGIQPEIRGEAPLRGGTGPPSGETQANQDQGGERKDEPRETA